MSAGDAERFIARNVNDRRDLSYLSDDQLEQHYDDLGNDSGESHYCDSCGSVPVSNEGDWCPKCDRRAQDEYNESANADYGRHFD